MTLEAELARLVERIQPADSHAADEVRAALADFQRPITCMVTGRAGAGKSTVVTAFDMNGAVETSPIDSLDVPDPVLDADLVVYVIAETLQPADRAALASVPPHRVVAVLNKADAIDGGRRAALARANEYMTTLGAQTFPVVACTAAATRSETLKPAEVSSLRTLALTADASITLSSDLFLAAPVMVDVRARRTMLARWELFGLDCALTALRHDPDLDPVALTQLIHAATGVEPAKTAVAQRRDRLLALRGGELLDSVERIAARSAARDRIEDFLRSDTAAQVGLTAGLAWPGVADMNGGRSRAYPADAYDALRLADWWRTFASGPIDGASRRAALRIHHGYVRAWSKLGGHV